LRREKERNEKEREELRQLASGKRRAEQEEDRRINILLEQVSYLLLCRLTWKDVGWYKTGLVQTNLVQQ
jgi:hypothetical protein